MDLTSHHSIKWIVFFVGVLASWMSFSNLLPAFIFVLIWLSVLVFLAVQKSYLRYMLILFSAWIFLPLITFLDTTRHYFKGDAAFFVTELSSPDLYNLDPKYRVWYEKKGPVMWGDEVLVRASNNFAIRFWVTLHGYQKGAYAGIYPDAIHVAQIISTNGKFFDFEKTPTAVRITFPDGVYEMSDVRYAGAEDLNGCTKAKVTFINDELILVKPLIDKPNITYLGDYKASHIIGRYFDSGKTQQKEIKRKKKRRTRSDD